MSGEPLVATVRLSPLVDRLYVTPRVPAQRHAIAEVLRDQLGVERLQGNAAGIAIQPVDAPRLLTGNPPGVRMRWQPDARVFAENRRWIGEVRPRVLADIRTVLKGGRTEAERRLAGQRGLEVLDDHQWVNVAAMTTPNGFGLCVFDEQGAGKTVTFIFALDVLVSRDEVDFALIIAPKSMVAEWPQDFARFMGSFYRVVVLSGSRAEKRRALARKADVVVTNFETAVSMEAELRAHLGRYGRRSVLVVDESYAIKNLDAARTRSLRRLREWAGRAFVLCGTPAPNTAIDVVQQVSLVDFGTSFDGVDIPVDRHAAQAVVQQILEAFAPYVRHLKRDVLPGLPVKRFTRVLLPLQPLQSQLYSRALQNFVQQLQDIDDSSFLRELPSFLARRSALLQICSNPRGLDRRYNETPAKLLALDALLKELIGRRREKVVLWSFYTASLDAIVKRYARFNPVRYDGTVARVEDRREAVRRFQDDDETFLFVGNPAAAGAGLTLHRARYAIYESMSNQGAHYLQSLDRIHRRGQEREVEYFVLLCEKTVEVNEYETLTAKDLAGRQLLRDQIIPAPTRDSMLLEVLAAAAELAREGDDGPDEPDPVEEPAEEAEE